MWIVLALLVVVVLMYIYEMYVVRVYRFYRPTCPYCIESQAEWDKFKSMAQFTRIRPIDVDLDAKPAFKERFGVSSVPTVMLVDRDGAHFTYDGPRLADDYYSWVYSTIKP